MVDTKGLEKIIDRCIDGCNRMENTWRKLECIAKCMTIANILGGRE